ncbi:MAG: cyclic nucleotide-binding domain-containing protein [Pseudobdellovibrionaceae bacterium]
MTRLTPEEKRVFIIASGDPDRVEHLTSLVNSHIRNSLIFSASDGIEAIFKMENSPPHILITDVDLPKITGIDLTEKVLHHSKLNGTSVIIVAPIPDREHFVDQVVTGQVQFLADMKDDRLATSCFMKALNRLVDQNDFTYRLRFLAPEDVLFNEGEEAKSVFIVKSGELNAIKLFGSATRVLGQIQKGEFVGEMAHINDEPRSATVKALSDCELIEIPFGTLDTVLFSKPAWSKALMATLSKRLKRSNESI